MSQRTLSTRLTSHLLLVVLALTSLSLLSPSAQAETVSAAAGDPSDGSCDPAVLGSPFIPVDSWVYPAAMRLYSLGYLNHIYLGLRPWTRSSLRNALEEMSDAMQDAEQGTVSGEALSTFEALKKYVGKDGSEDCTLQKPEMRLESTYTLVRGISGTPLRDSAHLGATIINDYGRPYQNGLNNYTGLSGYATAGRFTVYVRGEFQGAPSAAGYSQALSKQLAALDYTIYPVLIDPATGLPVRQSTIPAGPIDTTVQGNLLEAYASAQVLNHVFSFGKQDTWYGSAKGAGMGLSNNAENFYTFRINRIEPLYVPLLSKLTGPFRYEFLIGPLKGQTYPKDSWMHAQKISFRPTENLEFGFERSAIWGGKGHTPVTLRTFLKSFFSVKSPTTHPKAVGDVDDPGARFAEFDFSYKLPFLRNWLTIYTDSTVHDDLWAISAPRRGGWRPGLYLAKVPGMHQLDLRVEGVMTDPPVSRSQHGRFMYWETARPQGYTNNGQMMGDWIGREAKGGQAWMTYHLSPREWVQISFRNQKVAKDFIAGGTTLNDVNFELVKRFGREKDLELRGQFTLERWKAPIYKPGLQTVTSTTIGLTWYPERKVSF